MLTSRKKRGVNIAKLSFISIFLIILMSNTMFFGLIERKKTFCIYAIIAIVVLIRARGINKKNIKTLLFFSLLMFLNLFLNAAIVGKSDLVGTLEILIIMTITMILIENVTKREFVKYYVWIMYFIAIISLVCFSIAQFAPAVANKIYFMAHHGVRQYRISVFYTWGWGGLFTRNPGPFWEPGAFQGFLNIAFILLLRYKNFFKKVNLKIIIFMITILTTQSTTGYIVFLIIAIIFNKDIYTLFKGKYKILKRILIIIGIISAGLIIIYSGNISNKFSAHNGSKIIRVDDFYNSLKMISDRPIIGYGVGQFKNTQEALHNIHNNSNGLLYLWYSQGILVFIFYLSKLKSGIKNMFDMKSGIKSMVIFILFLILYFTEGLAWLPFYMLFLFELKEE